jgi:hypothetical protein
MGLGKRGCEGLRWKRFLRERRIDVIVWLMKRYLILRLEVLCLVESGIS